MQVKLSPKSAHQLLIMSWNLENFFLLPKKIDPSDKNQIFFPSDLASWIKPAAKVSAVADTIRRYQPHIVFVQEVGGVSALESFCEEYFPRQYQVLHAKGNSERGIEIAYLVHQDLPFEYELISHAHHPLDLSHIPHPNINYRRLFERNVLELRFKTHEGSVALFGVHLKSGHDPTGKDPEGRLKRQGEVNGLVEIVSNSLNHGVSEYILMGDFNGVATPEAPSSEFLPLFRLPGIHELLQLIGVPRSERGTFLHSVLRELQLDYIFLSQGLLARVDHATSGIVHLRDIGGGPFRWPTSTAAKQNFASDHLPLICTLKF